jgi:hypothetical protein
MSARAKQPQLFPLALLLFSVGGVNFGADTGQVLGTAAHQGEGGPQEPPPVWFHKAVEFARSPAYVEPTALLVKPRGRAACRVIIDAMQEIVEVDADEIKPFPAVLEPFARRRGLWGVYPRAGRMFFLVDLERLADTQRAGLN